MHNVWITASAWMGVAMLASLISIRIGVSVALIEIVLGVLAGNAFGFHTSDWINFLASFGAVLLTFLAGAEIDPGSLSGQFEYWDDRIPVSIFRCVRICAVSGWLEL